MGHGGGNWEMGGDHGVGEHGSPGRLWERMVRV